MSRTISNAAVCHRASSDHPPTQFAFSLEYGDYRFVWIASKRIILREIWVSNVALYRDRISLQIKTNQLRALPRCVNQCHLPCTPNLVGFKFIKGSACIWCSSSSPSTFFSVFWGTIAFKLHHWYVVLVCWNSHPDKSPHLWSLPGPWLWLIALQTRVPGQEYWRGMGWHGHTGKNNSVSESPEKVQKFHWQRSLLKPHTVRRTNVSDSHHPGYLFQRNLHAMEGFLVLGSQLLIDHTFLWESAILLWTGSQANSILKSSYFEITREMLY